MKNGLYIIWGFFLSFIFINTCFASKTIELGDPIIEFPKVKGYTLQGFTTTDKYLFLVLVKNDDSSSIIKVYDLNTYDEIKSMEHDSLGHANDITYNKNNDKIYVLSSGGSNDVFVFDGDTLEYKDKFKIEVPARSITYIEDEDMYAVRTISVGYMLNNRFSLISKIPFIIGMNFNIDIGRQGWAYYNGYIYYSNWSWVRYGGDGTNIIYVYDLDGKVQEIFCTKDNIGEIEDVSFFNNKLILGFNGYDGMIKFYRIDIPKIEKTEEIVVNEVIDDTDNSYIICFIVSLGIIIVILVSFLSIRNKKMST